MKSVSLALQGMPNHFPLTTQIWEPNLKAPNRESDCSRKMLPRSAESLETPPGGYGILITLITLITLII
jgi:hypothetical protein